MFQTLTSLFSIPMATRLPDWDQAEGIRMLAVVTMPKRVGNVLRGKGVSRHASCDGWVGATSC